jgi:glyoxylase-like metal-dependent hydrolase (beta-lactamase superfamily II)
VDEVGDSNPDPQKYRFQSAKGRWGERPEDQSTKPKDERRNVVAKGATRFEIESVAPQQPAWEQLSANVLCVLGFNPSAFTLNGTCCYLVGTGKRRLLIDTGEDGRSHDKFMAALDECMVANGIEGLQEILITHMHHDHYGGVPGLLKRYGADTPVAKIPNPQHYFSTMEAVRERGLIPFLEHEDGTPRYRPKQGEPRSAEIPAEFVLTWPDEDAEAGNQLPWDPAQRTKLEFIRDYSFVKRSHEVNEKLENVWNFHRLSHGDVICTEGATLIAYHTPGHAMEHCSFWLQEDKCLFSGDHVLGWGTTFMMDLYDYMKTLEFMVALRPIHLYPGHGPMIEDGTGLLERYIVHRKEREDQVEDALLQCGTPLSCNDLVDILYTQTPTHRLWMARENVSKILRKFDKSGIAMSFVRQGDGTLTRFDFPRNWMAFRSLPPGLVWLHRFHFRTEVREGQREQARL